MCAKIISEVESWSEERRAQQAENFDHLKAIKIDGRIHFRCHIAVSYIQYVFMGAIQVSCETRRSNSRKASFMLSYHVAETSIIKPAPKSLFLSSAPQVKLQAFVLFPMDWSVPK